MISTFWNAEPVWLLDLQPSYDAPIAADVSLIATTDAGLTNREARRGFGLTPRFRTKFKILAQGADARRLQGALRTYQNEPVFLPLWPAAVAWSGYGARLIGGGINLVFKDDWSQWALFAPGWEPLWPAAGDTVVPVLQGRLEVRTVTWLGPELAEFAVDHSEASPAAAAITVAAVGWTNGPLPSVAWGAAPYMYPFEVDFAGNVGQENLITILREEVGFTRLPAETLYPQAVARRDQGSHFMQSQTEWASMLRFFIEHGSGKAFWSGDWVSAADLTVDVNAADLVLQVSDVQGLLGGDWLALLGTAGGPGGVTATARIASLPDATHIDLTGAGLTAPGGGPAPAVMKAVETLVSHLVLARFDVPKITLQWHSNDYAECLLKLHELPAEYVPAGDETLGTTIGILPARCYLYEFSRVLGGVTYTDRWTNFENDLIFGGNNYTCRRIAHGDIRFTLQADQTQVDVKSDLVAGSALVLLATLQMEAPLMLVIRSADTDGVNATNGVVLFFGEVEMASVVGNRITGRASCAGARFDRKVPRFVLQTGCNYALFGAGCTLLTANWRFTAQVQNPGAPGYPYAFVLNSLARSVGAAPAYTQDWFAGGWIEFGAGLTYQRRGILLSTVPAAGVLTVTLDRDPAPFPSIGNAVVLFPGCDGLFGTCIAKFNNELNFGGHPFLPASNPSLIQQQVNGGKK